MSEPMIEVLGDVYLKTGFIKKVGYRLIFTDDAALFSHVNKEVRKQEEKEFIEDFKGKSFKERMGQMFTMNKRIYEKYEQMSIDEILNIGTESFSLPFKDIEKIKRRVFFIGNDGDKQRPTNVTIFTNNKKLKLSFSDERVSNRTYKFIKGKIK